MTVIIGRVTITPFLQGIDSLVNVTFLLNGEERWSTAEYPCGWTLNEPGFGLHTLEVRGYYAAGDVVRQSMRVVVFNTG